MTASKSSDKEGNSEDTTRLVFAHFSCGSLAILPDSPREHPHIVIQRCKVSKLEAIASSVIYPMTKPRILLRKN